MDINWLYVYIAGWVLTALALLGKGAKPHSGSDWLCDIAASILIGTVWFIYVPVVALRKLFRT